MEHDQYMLYVRLTYIIINLKQFFLVVYTIYCSDFLYRLQAATLCCYCRCFVHSVVYVIKTESTLYQPGEEEYHFFMIYIKLLTLEIRFAAVCCSSKNRRKYLRYFQYCYFLVGIRLNL